MPGPTEQAFRPQSPTSWAASLVSDGLGPLPPLAALCGAGATATGVLPGIGWGLLAMSFAAILPYLLTWKIRHPAGGGRLSPRARASYLGLAVVTAAIGLVVLRWLGAPGVVVSAVIAIVAGLVVVAFTNARWGWSNHMAACAAGVGMLVVLFGPPGLWAAIALPAVAWARLALRRHTSSELVYGGLVGAVISGAVLALLT